MMKIAAVLAAVALTAPALADDAPADKGAVRGMMKSTRDTAKSSTPADKGAERGMTKTLNKAKAPTRTPTTPAKP